jgi:hypothetical protein
MNLDNLFQFFLSFTGTFNIGLLITLFIICFAGEFHIAIPYLLEMIWLLSGYNVATGVLTPSQFMALWLTSQAGRQVGAASLFYLAYAGSKPITNFYNKHFKGAVSQKVTDNFVTRSKWFRSIDVYSPFSVALGRLFWLRIPLTIFLGIQKKLTANILGILISGAIWDAMYIVPGILGKAVGVKPVYMVIYSLGGLTVLYAVTFFGRRLLKRRKRKDIPVDDPAKKPEEPD